MDDFQVGDLVFHVSLRGKFRIIRFTHRGSDRLAYIEYVDGGTGWEQRFTGTHLYEATVANLRKASQQPSNGMAFLLPGPTCPRCNRPNAARSDERPSML